MAEIPTDAPRLINHRMQFTSLHEYVEQICKELEGHPVTSLDDNFPDILFKILSHFLSRVQFDFLRGAEKGLTETMDLIKDPLYYQTVRERRRRNRKRHEEQELEQEISRMEREQFPTVERIVSEIRQAENSVQCYEQWADRERQKIVRLHEEIKTVGNRKTQ